MNMARSETDIGYCISKVLKDYSVMMEPYACLILSSPLWLGMNAGKVNSYSPVDRDVVAYMNPLFLENFSVSSNSLFLPVRGNSKDHLAYLVQRLNNRRKTLVKLSGNVFGSGSGGGHSSVLGVVESITGEPGSGGTLIEVVFSAANALMMPEAEFVRYWCNTEWFTLIPSQNRVDGQLMEMKLRAAITRQCYGLRPGYGTVVTGSAVLEYLKDELKEKEGRYRAPEAHVKLWQKARGIVDLRRRYAFAMDYLDFAGGTVASLNKDLEAWEEFYAVLGEDVTAQRLAGLYDMLAARENEMTGHFKAMA